VVETVVKPALVIDEEYKASIEKNFLKLSLESKRYAGS